MGSLMSVRAQVIRGTETSTADGRRLIATNIFGMQQMLGVLAGQTVFNGDGSGLTNNWGSYSLLPYSYSLVSSNQAAQIAQLFAGSSSSSAFSSISVTGAVGNGIANGGPSRMQFTARTRQQILRSSFRRGPTSSGRTSLGSPTGMWKFTGRGTLR